MNEIHITTLPFSNGIIAEKTIKINYLYTLNPIQQTPIPEWKGDL